MLRVVAGGAPRNTLHEIGPNRRMMFNWSRKSLAKSLAASGGERRRRIAKKSNGQRATRTRPEDDDGDARDRTISRAHRSFEASPTLRAGCRPRWRSGPRR